MHIKYKQKGKTEDAKNIFISNEQCDECVLVHTSVQKVTCELFIHVIVWSMEWTHSCFDKLRGVAMSLCVCAS